VSLWYCKKCDQISNMMICSCGTGGERVTDFSPVNKKDIDMSMWTCGTCNMVSNTKVCENMTEVQVNPSSTGIFITLEGGECCGKGTQIKLLAESLREAYPDKEVIEIFDPGSTYMGQEIRRLVKNVGGDDAPTTFCELFLFSAARVQMVDKLIRPNLEKGNIVISDRFIDSTTIYQGRMNKNSMEKIEKINEVIDCYPDLTFILDIDEETFMKRMESRKGDKFDRYDTKGIEFHRNVYQEYRDLYEEEKDKRALHLVKSKDTPEEVNKVLFNIASLHIDVATDYQTWTEA
jgi:dTMP kinase